MGLRLCCLHSVLRNSVSTDWVLFEKPHFSACLRNELIWPVSSADMTLPRRSVNILLSVNIVVGRTSLMVAAENGQLAVCDYLIRQGARLDSVDAEGLSVSRLLYNVSSSGSSLFTSDEVVAKRQRHGT